MANNDHSRLTGAHTKECGSETGSIGGGRGTPAVAGAQALAFTLTALDLLGKALRLRLQLTLALPHKLGQQAALAPREQQQWNSGAG